MAGTEDKSKNDSEVRDILSRNIAVLPDSQSNKSKSLSPILGGGSVNRRFLHGRRLRGRKSRVRLTDRFKATEKDSCDNTPLKDETPEFTEDSFTLSQNEDLIKQIEKLEEIENKRNKIYNMLVAERKDSEFCFKKPASPLLNKAKKTKMESDVDESVCLVQNTGITTIPVLQSLPSCSGFQTAKGKSILLSENEVRKHSKLFDDIICDSSRKCDLRRNKYSFLSKSKSEVRCNDDFLKFDIKLALSESDIDSNKSKKLLNEEQTKFDPYIVLEGVENAFKPYSYIWENQEGNLLTHQNLPTQDISLTQEIRESGISNTQMLRAADEALSSMGSTGSDIDHGFRGFYKEEVMVYENIFERFVNIYKSLQNQHRKCSKKSIFSMTGNSETNKVHCKRLTDDLFLPPQKRIKSIEGLEDIKEDLRPTVENKENQEQFVKGFNLGGFSSASGKAITISENSLRKAKNIFDDIENELPVANLRNVQSKTSLSGINITSHIYNSALGTSCKQVVKTEDSLQKVQHKLDLDLPIKRTGKSLTEVQSKTAIIGSNNVSNSPRHSTKFDRAPGKLVNLSDDSLNINSDFSMRNTREVTSKTSLHHFSDSPNNTALPGFSSASGKSISFSNTSLQRARNVFEKLDSEPLKEKRSKTNLVPTSHSCQKLGRTKLEILEPIPESGESDDSMVASMDTRQSFSRTAISVQSEPPTRGPRNIFADFDLSDIAPLGLKNPTVKPGFQTLKGKSLQVPKQLLVRPLEKTVSSEITPSKDYTKGKKTLGVSFCKLLPISNSNLERAKQMFEKDFSKASPMRSGQTNVYSSTPVRRNVCSTSSNMNQRPSTSPAGQGTCSTPIQYDSVKSSSSFCSFLQGTAITPIKPDATENRKSDYSPIYDQQVLLTSPTKGDVVDWLIKLQNDREKLERRLRIVLERQRIMESFVGEKCEEDKRPREGVLFRKKATSNRMSLELFVDNKRPGEESMNYELFQISPENAEYLHFKEQTCAAVTTQDGAVVIPNLRDVIGLTEITTAFTAMSGVDPRLVPKGWIRNHYKWIIWKLTSYARMFPVRFGSCLNIENVIQQLKYRYDREIDKAERSALRRIYEKDDAPQKRLVLCVSRIKEVNPNEYELELTDGWYGIRTIIDEPLSGQVSKHKIQVGIKLLISGAELLNCDGCYPLEATELTCLKIHYNCTRRAHWNARLGYQPNPEPFPVLIQCLHPLGGPIGAIKVCIVRMYPFKYLEKFEGRSVWRSKKAEQRRAQQWENERRKKMEEIREKVIREFEIAHRKQTLHSSKRCSTTTLSTSSPRLGEGLDNSDDSDSIQSNVSTKMQQEIAEKIREHVSRLRLPKRDVTAVLKLLVVDISGSTDRGYSFFVWRPCESHLQMLREGMVATVRNVLPRKNGDLNSYAKTTFKQESPAPHVYKDFKRKLTEIAELTHSTFSPIFNEFDTVGLVVHVKIEISCQEVWLADRFGRLLLINIYEGPTTCLILDSVKRGQATTVCNLVYRGITDSIPQALANYFTVFSCYSQHRHLQEGLDMFRRQFPKDLRALLNDCDRRIENFSRKNRSISNNNFSTIFEDEDESTLISSRLTSTDIALSLIDMDRYT